MIPIMITLLGSARDAPVLVNIQHIVRIEESGSGSIIFTTDDKVFGVTQAPYEVEDAIVKNSLGAFTALATTLGARL